MSFSQFGEQGEISLKPYIKEIIKLSPDYPEELVVLEIIGSLSNKYSLELFKKISLITSKFTYVVIVMSNVMMISPSVIDKFTHLAVELDIRGKKLTFVNFPSEMYTHQIKMYGVKEELYLFKSIEDALKSLGINS
jgi:anti-anti-sigma regulatory factor